MRDLSLPYEGNVPSLTLQKTQLLSVLLLLLGYVVLPLFAWVPLVALVAGIMRIQSKVLATLVVFAFAMLIASRHLGYLYGKSDDLPSYLLAYEAYSSFLSVLPLTVLYAKNGDVGFAYLSYAIQGLTDTHLFLYFFSIVALSLWAYLRFAKAYAGAHWALFCLLCYLMFFKTFQIQWMIIRSCLALPILLLSLHYVAHDQRKKGILLYLVGFSLHGATAILFFPALLYGRALKEPLDFARLAKYAGYLLIAGIVVGGVLMALGSYVIAKVMSQDLGFNAENAVVYIVPLVLGVLVMLQCENRFLKNVILYFLLIGAFGFVFGKNFYRFVHPLLFLLPIMVVYLSEALIKRHRLAHLIRPAYVVLCYLSFTYVMQLDEPNFYYKDPLIVPENVTGAEQVQLFDQYVEEDVIYYKGWRTR
ncbi:EpsG family protein [Pseudidiomarina sediminum]|uniref:EpsG family protein n=1 Tax=Pseudidiomarina sediminum TaxID=431675 RepID=UPI001C989EE1|nr:EpsG family protein [Pseudidiomarina sediminum]MBY6063738.1 EpsG family protein [Pseudidiomarina sediminum]